MTTRPESMFVKTSAPTTEARASVEPTERSMPRVRMTSSWPIDSTAMAAVAARTLPRFLAEKKNGDRSERITTRARRMRSGPMRNSRSPSSSPRSRWAAPRPAVAACSGRSCSGRSTGAAGNGVCRGTPVDSSTSVPPGRRQIVGCLSRFAGPDGSGGTISPPYIGCLVVFFREVLAVSSDGRRSTTYPMRTRRGRPADRSRDRQDARDDASGDLVPGMRLPLRRSSRPSSGPRATRSGRPSARSSRLVSSMSAGAMGVFTASGRSSCWRASGRPSS